jgi:hypothetical protein
MSNTNEVLYTLQEQKGRHRGRRYSKYNCPDFGNTILVVTLNMETDILRGKNTFKYTI